MGTKTTYYGIAEIAEAVGQRRQTVAQWYKRNQLPAPAAVLKMGPVWTEGQLAEVLKSKDKLPARP